MTLDWLLVLAAVAGIAAVSVLGVQSATDHETRRPPDPAARLVQADVAATFLEHEALELIITGGIAAYTGSADREYAQRCAAIRTDYGDVVRSAVWRFDGQWSASYLDGEDADGNTLPGGTRRSPARCEVTPRDLSAGP